MLGERRSGQDAPRCQARPASGDDWGMMIPKCGPEMQTTDEEDARINADVERLIQLINSVATKIGARPLCFDGKELRAHPELNRELISQKTTH